MSYSRRLYNLYHLALGLVIIGWVFSPLIRVLNFPPQTQTARAGVTTNNPSANSGSWTNPTNAYADGTSYANITSASPSATHTYNGYGFDLTGNTIDQVRVRVDASSVGGSASSQQRLPTADGDVSGTWQIGQVRTSTGTGVSAGTWTASAGNLYDVAAEVIWEGNDDSDYINGTTDTGNNYQLFTYSAFAVPTGATVVQVQVYERTSDVGTAGQNNIRSALRVNGTVYSAGSRNPAGNGVQTWNNTAIWTTNPNTLAAWTVADVNGTGSNPLQQFGVFSTDGNPDVKVYSVFAIVIYTYNEYEAIDETSSGDADFIIGTTDVGGYDYFTSSAFSVPDGSTITNLTVNYRATDLDQAIGTNAIRAALKVNGTLYGTTATVETPIVAWGNYSYAFATNPNTGAAWTVADINGTGSNPLQQFGVNSADLQPDVGISMLYATVNYTTANNETIEVDVSWDGGTNWSASKHQQALTNSEATYWVDVTSDTAWTPTKLNDTNFRVRVDALTVGDTGDVRLDWIPVEVTYDEPPTITVDEPDGTSDTVAAGATYDIQYDLADPDDVVTAAFYYDSDSSGLNGTVISGACATAAEGTNVTCAWDTTGVTGGTYYIYGVASDGNNPSVSDYSPGQITIQAGSLSVDIVDSGGSSVASPSLAMDNGTVSVVQQTATGSFGTANQKIRVTNTTATASWTLSLAPTSGATAVWDSAGTDYDFNDPTAGAGDGGDADSVGGQMTINASVGTITPEGGCASTGLTKGSSSSFSQGVTDSITLLTAGGTAETGCYWDFTGISVSQTIPAEQPAASDYDINMTVSVVAS